MQTPSEIRASFAGGSLVKINIPIILTKPLHKKMVKVVTWFLALAAMGGMCVHLTLYSDYMRNMPRIPHPELGRVYSYSIKGFYVYLTEQQYCLITFSAMILIAGFLSAAVLNMIFRGVWDCDSLTKD